MTRATLTLLRHAKSSWTQQQSDHDRPLNGRGNSDAPDMGQRMVERNSLPGLILCSSAQRTRETAAHLLGIFGDPAPQIQYDKALYLASPEVILEALEHVPESIQHVMVIAHNPGIEDLSAELQGVREDTMPTAAIRQFLCASIPGLRQQMQATRAQNGADNDSTIELIFSDYPKSRR